MSENAEQDREADGSEARDALSALVEAIGSAKDSDWSPDLHVALPDEVGDFSPCVAAFVAAAREMSDDWRGATSMLIEMSVLFEVFSREAQCLEVKEAAGIFSLVGASEDDYRGKRMEGASARRSGNPPTTQPQHWRSPLWATTA